MIPLYLFLFAGLFSPGPNVILLFSSGARFGFQRTLPHICGVALGVGILGGAVGLGVGSLLQAIPVLRIVLSIAAFLWIVYLAYRLWMSDPAKQHTLDHPFTFFQAILFQWVNPKIWAVALAALAYVDHLDLVTVQALNLAVAFTCLNFAICLFWTKTGHVLALLIEDPKVWRWFNRIMAVFLACSGLLVFL